MVSLVVERGAPPPPPKERLVSVNGKFQTVADPPAPGPNGTAFTITVAPGAAEILDRTNVIVGKVLEGQEVVDALAALPTVKDNSASPFSPWRKQSGINGDGGGTSVRKTIREGDRLQVRRGRGDATGGDGERRGDGTLVRR